MKIIILLTLSLNILCFSQFTGGSGTVEDPYQIATADQLNQVRNYMSSSFIQIADIDLGVAPWNVGEGWDPIGDYNYSDPSKSFRGNYNGQSFIIMNMYIDKPEMNNIGLFGCCQTAKINNIILKNISVIGSSNTGGLIGYNTETTVDACIISGSIDGQSSVGLLIGYNFCDNIINNCYSTGSVTGYLNNVGGLIGFNLFDNIVINCGTTTDVTGYRDFIGGLIGESYYCIKIENCYSKGLIISINRDKVGGLIGGSHNDSVIKNSYSQSKIISYNDSSCIIGGFIGGCGKLNPVEIVNCYSTGEVVGGYEYVGGFIGLIDPEISIVNSYWDTEASGIDSSAAGEGRTTAGMVYPYELNTYVGWDFDTVWRDDVANQNKGYPTFKWVSGIEHNEDDFLALEKGFELYQNYPNPFNPVTQIRFDLARASNVKLSVFNIGGQKVAELVNGIRNPGHHTVDFNGSNLNSGVYYYILETDGKAMTEKMVLCK